MVDAVLSTKPCRRSSMPGSTARVSATRAVQLTAMTPASARGSRSACEPYVAKPALLTSRSTGRPAMAATSVSMPAGSARSAVTSSAAGAAGSRESATARRRPASRPVSSSRALRAASRRAISAPMPEEAPVTTVRFVSWYVMVCSFEYCSCIAGQQRTGCSTRLVSSRVRGHDTYGVTSGTLPCLPPCADSSRHVEFGILKEPSSRVVSSWGGCRLARCVGGGVAVGIR